MHHERSVSNAEFGPDGKRVVTASGDTVTILDTVTVAPSGQHGSNKGG